MRRILALSAALAALAACQSQTTMALRNPTTGQTVQCRSNPMAGDVKVLGEICARGFERAGFVRVPQ